MSPDGRPKSGNCVASPRERSGMEIKMIDFEEELKNFKPSLEVEEAEQAIYNHELTDMTDVLREMMQDMKRQM